MGWAVIRIWEHEINRNPITCINIIRIQIKSCPTSGCRRLGQPSAKNC
jgi:very-short-patch-repair endonuclease